MSTRIRNSMPFMILIGGGLGVVTGLLLPELSGILRYVGEIYIQLLLMCVYPYIIASLLHGLGKMDREIASRVFKKSWIFYVAAWLIVLGTMMILGTIFPAPAPPKVIFPSQQGMQVDLIAYFIPGNFFQSISKNYVPAVVFFAVVFGVAMQGIKKKDTFLEITDQIKKACVIIWNWIVYLAPLGVFALFANTAATIDPQNFEGLLIYILIFFIIAIVLTFVILPMIITALVPISNRELIKGIQNGLLLAIVTNLAVVAIPIINDFVIRQSREKGIDKPNLADFVGTQISIAYPLVQLGNLFVAFYILYGSFYFNSPLSFTQHLLLPPLTLLSTFGSPSTAVEAVNFISTVFECQSGFSELFVASSSLTRFAQVAVSVMGFTFVTLLATFYFYGKLVYKPQKLIRAVIVFIVFIGLVYVGAKSISPFFHRTSTISYQDLKISEDLLSNTNAKVFLAGDTVTSTPDSSEFSQLDIHQPGILRVGYYDGFCPFTYINKNGELVGFDVALIYKLADDLKFNLEFYPINPSDFTKELSMGNLDIVIGGFIVTARRLHSIKVSHPYFHSRDAFLVRTEQAKKLYSYEDLKQHPELVVGAYDNPKVNYLIKTYCPDNPVVTMASYKEIIYHPEVDFVFWTLEKATAFAFTYPGFSVVASQGIGTNYLLAFYMSYKNEALKEYINYWIDLQKTNGFIEEQKKYWLKGMTLVEE